MKKDLFFNLSYKFLPFGLKCALNGLFFLLLVPSKEKVAASAPVPAYEDLGSGLGSGFDPDPPPLLLGDQFTVLPLNCLLIKNGSIVSAKYLYPYEL